MSTFDNKSRHRSFLNALLSEKKKKKQSRSFARFILVYMGDKKKIWQCLRSFCLADEMEREAKRGRYFSCSDARETEREREACALSGSRPCPIAITSRAADSVQNDKGFRCSLRNAIDKTTKFFSLFLFLFSFLSFFFSYLVFVFSFALSPPHSPASARLSWLACR